MGPIYANAILDPIHNATIYVMWVKYDILVKIWYSVAYSIYS